MNWLIPLKILMVSILWDLGTGATCSKPQFAWILPWLNLLFKYFALVYALMVLKDTYNWIKRK